MCVDTEMIGIWLDELFTNEIEEIEGTIENERLWALGCDEEPNPHIQNIANHEEYLSILRELKEEAMQRVGSVIPNNEDTTCAAYHVVEADQSWYFKTTPGDELLGVAEKLNAYLGERDSAASPMFIKAFAGLVPITEKEFYSLVSLRMMNTGKVCGAFYINFDDQQFSAVNIMDGWKEWPLHKVSAAVDQISHMHFSSIDEKWREFLDAVEN